MKAMLILALACLVFSASAQTNCLDADQIKKLDANWENSLLTSDADYLMGLLADNFVWIHSTGYTDTKRSLIEKSEKARASNRQNTRSRTQSAVEVVILGSTAVVTGYTVVDRGPKPTRYNFMRTYAQVEEACLLLSNHTMVIPKEDQ